jgi:PAS domain S-box-containing protein
LIAGLVVALIMYLALVLIERRNRQLSQKNVELASSEARVRLVVEAMPALLVALDEDGGVLAWNSECERVTGYSAAEVMGTSPKFLFGSASSSSNIGSLGASGDYRDLESKLKAKDGSLREVAWTRLAEAIPIPGWASWQIGIDVTARNLMARESQDLLEQSLQRQKLESVGLLAGGIAHDFNNLLTVILGNASLAYDIISSSSPARRAVDGILQATQRATLLTQQLLAYTGKGTFQTVPIDLSELVQEIGTLLRSAISKKIGLHFELGEDLPAVEADPAQMQQLVMNLVINACEAAAEGEQWVRVATDIQHLAEGLPAHRSRAGQALPPGEYLRLSVSDGGLGFDEATGARVFDPFFSTKEDGHGLGLAAVLGIVRGHAGGLRLVSEPGVGTTFEVLLPVSDLPPGEGEPATQAADGGVPAGSVLVIDDEAPVRDVVAAILAEDGVPVWTAEDGEAGLEVLARHGGEVRLILLDLTMPGLSGEETCRRIRASHPDIPVIATSGYSDLELDERLRDLGVVAFLKKPYPYEKLSRLVRKYLGGSGVGEGSR